MNNRIKEVIKEKGYTITSLAAELNITRETLSRNLDKPSSSTLERLSEHLSVPIWQFFATKEDIIGNESVITCPHCGKPIKIITSK